MEIDFAKGFNILTGETGAGKSIIVGALSLILGERADSIAVFDKAKKCIVEGNFSLPENNAVLQDLLHSLDLDAENEIWLRREIAPNGKSRAFVNDTPVSLSQLKQVSAVLVDLHQQFDTLELGAREFQRAVIDSMAKTKTTLADFQKIYKERAVLLKEIAILKQQQFEAGKAMDYNKYLYQELAEANLQPGLLENLEAELKMLNNGEQLKTGLQHITNGLLNGDQPLVQFLKQYLQQLKLLGAFHQKLVTLQERLQASIIELDDIGTELEQLNEHILPDAERIEIINDRLHTGYKLFKKHNVTTTEALLQIKDDLELQMQVQEDTEGKIKEKEKRAGILETEAQRLAGILHEKREAASGPFAKNTNAILHRVGMPGAKIKISVEPVALNEYGKSDIEFLFDANQSGQFEPIRKVTSGGELSRLMLGIKSLVADSMQMPVLIFDEIDTGISGEAARQVGILLNGLAKTHQVICITHQAQIAAKAGTHFFVYKQIQENQVRTGIRVLSTEERITTIAQMLSGEKPTAAALQNAKEMVGN